mmetsp:Transcript_871/g.1178  ORF Transcript_871/g.1178 Transcript_871/m.1178 type:complete len:186 (+) Transcript_871:451-1008(+)
MGGYLSSLYTSYHYERVKALFCVSAAGVETYDPANYHPERYPDFDEPTKYLSAKMIAAREKLEARKGHPMAIIEKMVPEAAAAAIEFRVRQQILTENNPSTEAQAQALVDFQVAMFSNLSMLEVLEVMPLKFPFLVRHAMNAADRLGNPAIDAPIAHAFGDMDFFGTEGADDIVRGSKHFASGRS